MGVIEPCHCPYRNTLYLVKKITTEKYRLVNVAVEFYRVTARDANLPPSADEISGQFAGYTISSQAMTKLNWTKNLGTLQHHDPFRPLRMKKLAQGAINPVPQFVRIVFKILAAHLRNRALPFLEDVGVKGPKTTHINEELTPGVRRYVIEHI